jgi:hypothetical protein
MKRRAEVALLWCSGAVLLILLVPPLVGPGSKNLSPNIRFRAPRLRILCPYLGEEINEIAYQGRFTPLASIEEDFARADRSDEDNEDTFTNPNADQVS